MSITAFIGVGSMGGAILKGYLEKKSAQPDAAAGSIRATTRSAESAQKWANTPGLSMTATETDSAANLKAVRDATTVVLGVKPWAITETITEIAPALAGDATIISVAAGITIETMQAALAAADAPARVTVIRAMPNTPAHIGRGVTGLAAAADAPQEAVSKAVSLFQAVGEVLVVDEDRIDALSAVSGSGPAYLFWFTEQFIAAAERLGFSPEEAKLLAQNTVTGAAALLAGSDKSAAELRVAVTSPNGTTEQALKRFNRGFADGGMPELMDEALAAAVKRAAELAAG
ncbi:pyrroline-5-carboxylate reductase [Canibacter zhoujuaniae]|uniref:pyrroline-5-carboxylate reductase n=1 Tax=Canibacter zhoujuaniae TaxID=2708343 RepID=UPI001420F2D0|nr:pyrroline-5-carboxylate reductase [Canibacter zhoujuaniae]